MTTQNEIEIPKRGDARNCDAPYIRKQYRELTAAGWEFSEDGSGDELRNRGECWHYKHAEASDWQTLEDALRAARWHRKHARRQCSSKAHVCDQIIFWRIHNNGALAVRMLQQLVRRNAA